MFDSLLHRRRTPRGRRAAAFLLSTGPCGLLGSALVMGDPALPTMLEDAEPVVLVEWIAQAARRPEQALPGSRAPAGSETPSPRASPPREASMEPRPAPSQEDIAASLGPSLPVATGPSSGSTGVPTLEMGPPGGGTGCSPPESCGAADTCPPGESCGGGSGGVVEVTGLRVRRRVQPAFPAAARELGLDGARCTLELTVDERGKVADAQVSGCPSVFHASALTAAWRWRFAPLEVNGVARSARFRLVVNYATSNEP